MSELYEVKVFQQYDNQQVVNTFHYKKTGVAAAVTGSYALIHALGFINGFTPEVGNFYLSWKNTVLNLASFTECQVKAVYDVEDFFVNPLVTANTGQLTGEGSPSFVAYALQTNRIRSDIRRGNKRLVGADETHLSNYGQLESNQIATLQTFADDMSAILTYDDSGNTLSFTPVVVSKESYVTPSGNTAYKYYGTELAQLAKVAEGVQWTPKNVVTTQNSRKRGRGI